MTTIPLCRAVQGHEPHRHWRVDGRGWIEHAHPVRSEVHGHDGGLLAVRLSWAAYRWWRRELVVDLGHSAVLVICVALVWLAVLLATR